MALGEQPVLFLLFGAAICLAKFSLERMATEVSRRYLPRYMPVQGERREELN